jgi:hypothetical protein
MHGEPEPFDLDDKQQVGKDGPEFSRPRHDSGRRGSLPTAKAAILNNAKGYHPDALADKQTGQPSVSPSSILNTASSYLPSFLSGTSDSLTPHQANSNNKQSGKNNREKQPAAIPPNPLKNRSSGRTETFHHHAETLKDYVRDHKAHSPTNSVGLGTIGLQRERKGSTSSLRSVESAPSVNKRSSASDPLAALQDTADARLPAIKDGEGEAPEVLYNEGEGFGTPTTVFRADVER